MDLLMCGCMMDVRLCRWMAKCIAFVQMDGSMKEVRWVG